MSKMQRLMEEQDKDSAKEEKESACFVADGRFSSEGLTRRQFKKKMSQKFKQPKLGDLLADPEKGRTSQ